jgi:23S rRNA (pseudouridine1915-N3)-methyltransferase
MLKALPGGARVIALDVDGKRWSTEQLGVSLGDWMREGRDLALLVGGPEGLAASCLQRADERWSLSPLTFPHPLVRVILAEQLYRAWTLLKGHPYHRA